jgi:exoribonuclease R
MHLHQNLSPYYYVKFKIIVLTVFFRTLKGVLGDSGDINAETRGLLMTHNISEDPYPKDIEQYFPPPFTLENELKYRKDFRCCIFSLIN